MPPQQQSSPNPLPPNYTPSPSSPLNNLNNLNVPPRMPPSQMPPMQQTPPPQMGQPSKSSAGKWFAIILILLIIAAGAYFYFNQAQVFTLLGLSTPADDTDMIADSTIEGSDTSVINSGAANNSIGTSGNTNTTLVATGTTTTTVTTTTVVNDPNYKAPVITADVVSDLVDSSGKVTYYLTRFYEGGDKISPLIAIKTAAVVKDSNGNTTVTVSGSPDSHSDIKAPISPKSRDASDALASGDEVDTGDPCFNNDSGDVGYVVSICSSFEQVQIGGTGGFKNVAHK